MMNPTKALELPAARIKSIYEISDTGMEMDWDSI
jgi:hypothetical protein